MLGDFASLDVQNTYRGSDAYVKFQVNAAVFAVSGNAAKNFLDLLNN
ncbi:hypothetical protein [Piscirickettsia salmonis]|nr:hypothetical protein [Piscirickettsia salmonis]